jgi:hypothetical protein
VREVLDDPGPDRRFEILLGREMSVNGPLLDARRFRDRAEGELSSLSDERDARIDDPPPSRGRLLGAQRRVIRIPTLDVSESDINPVMLSRNPRWAASPPAVSRYAAGSGPLRRQ